MANDLFTDAIPVVIDTDGGIYTSDVVNNASYTMETGEPLYGVRYRSAWWSYTPATSGNATFDTQLSTTAGNATDTYLFICTGTAVNALTQVAFDDDSGGGNTSAISNLAVTAGTTYYIQVTSYGDYPINLVLRVTGPATPVAGAIPSADADVSAAGTLTVIYSVPPADTEVSDSGALAVVLKAPAAEVGVWAGTISQRSIRRVLSFPVNGARVPVVRPTFYVHTLVLRGRLSEPLGVDVQYSTDPTFATGAVILNTHASATRSVDSFRLKPFLDLPEDVPIFWRARLVLDDAPLGWTDAWQFTVDASVGDNTIPITWNVTADPPWPHLWSIDPQAGGVGTEVTILGQGLPTAPGSVTLDGRNMVISSWRHVAATAAGRTAARQLSVTGADADHDEIIALVPDGASAPGGVLQVEGD